MLPEILQLDGQSPSPSTHTHTKELPRLIMPIVLWLKTLI